MNNLITKSCILVAIFLSANAGYSADNLDDLVESCEKNQEKIQQLAMYLDELDRRRNLNWRVTFPWLEKELDHVV